MPGSRHLRQWTVFVAVFALLLKAAVPLFATAAASLQGESVAEICSVYGVRTVALAPADAAPAAQGHHAPDADQPPAHDPGPGALHSTDHCALAALAALAPQTGGTLVLPATAAPPAAAPRAGFGAVPDAPGDWAARLWHAPPAPRALPIAV